MSQLILGYTTIGDLLIKQHFTCIDDDNRAVQNKDIELEIPDYQRPYKWKAKHTTQLLNDIMQAMSANREIYRIGTLILHKKKEKTKFDIVDGQQRIITLSLLLHILLSKNPKENLIVQFLEQIPLSNQYTKFNIQNNFLVFKRRIDSMSKDKCDILKKYITDNCQLIIVVTDNQSEAFQFFDSQNARGKELYPHDLLKAYHLREMQNIDVAETEKTVKLWEDMEQQKLAELFGDYIYRIKEWIHGNVPTLLTSENTEKFKGLSHADNYPYASFYKGAFSYAEQINNSNVAFVSGTQKLKPFQLDAPIIAGKPFFEYAKHYFETLKDIQDNSQYFGYFINGNPIVETLDKNYSRGTGNAIARLLFDTAILLYVDRFCAENPTKESLVLLDDFVIYAFIWAYSLRFQRKKLRWQSAHNYILQQSDMQNQCNIYKYIANATSPIELISSLAEKILPITNLNNQQNIDENNYLYWFKKHNFIQG